MADDSRRAWLMPHVAPIFLDRVLPAIRETARVKGYAVAVHGSVARDIDLVAVPWIESALPADELVSAIFDAVRARLEGAGYMPDEVRGTTKPHGRRAWTIILGCGVFIDLSVMPLSPATTKTDGET